MRTVKVLMVVPDLGFSNGVATFAMSCYRKLRDMPEQPVEMDFAVLDRPDPSFVPELIRDGRTVFEIPSMKDRDAERKCLKFLKEKQYDVVHDNTLLRSLPLMRAAKDLDVPVRILHAHNPCLSDHIMKQVVERLLLPQLLACTNEAFACTEQTGDAFFMGKPFTVVPNVLPTEKFRYDEISRNVLRMQYDIRPEQKMILFAGRITEQKNPEFALSLMPDILKKEDAFLFFVGDSERDKKLTERIRRRIRKEGLEERVKLVGTQTNMQEWYSAADLMVMPSRFEGFGYTAIEAEICGLPVVASEAVSKEVLYAPYAQAIPLQNRKSWISFICQMLHDPTDRIFTPDCPFSDAEAGQNLSELYQTRVLQVYLADDSPRV